MAMMGRNRNLNSGASGFMGTHFADKDMTHKYGQRHIKIEDSTAMCNVHSILSSSFNSCSEPSTKNSIYIYFPAERSQLKIIKHDGTMHRLQKKLCAF
jgi:hypothetical protein